jgi:hypothetical protein
MLADLAQSIERAALETRMAFDLAEFSVRIASAHIAAMCSVWSDCFMHITQKQSLETVTPQSRSQSVCTVARDSKEFDLYGGCRKPTSNTFFG